MRYNVKYAESALREIVPKCKTMKEVILALGGKVAGGTYSHLKLKLQRFGISTEHFSAARKADPIFNRKLQAEDLLVLNRNNGYREHPVRLRRALKAIGVEEKCAVCGQGPEWNGLFLQLTIDHIDGNRLDNRESNLRYLCPNCHTQTPNYAGKGVTYRRSCGCGKLISSSATFCSKCRPPSTDIPAKSLKPWVPDTKPAPFQPKANWPSPEVLKASLWERPATEVAKDLGISSSALKKWCNRRGIETPPRGYWAKVEGAKVQEAKPKLACSKCDRPISAQSESGQCQSCYNGSEEKREKLRATAAKRRAGE